MRRVAITVYYDPQTAESDIRVGEYFALEDAITRSDVLVGVADTVAALYNHAVKTTSSITEDRAWRGAFNAMGDDERRAWLRQLRAAFIEMSELVRSGGATPPGGGAVPPSVDAVGGNSGTD